jgi:hypothetical protein
LDSFALDVLYPLEQILYSVFPDVAVSQKSQNIELNKLIDFFSKGSTGLKLRQPWQDKVLIQIPELEVLLIRGKQ